MELDRYETGRIRFTFVQVGGSLLYFIGDAYMYPAQNWTVRSGKYHKNRKPPESYELTGHDKSSVNASQLSYPGKQTYPAISHWVACQTNNGLAINSLRLLPCLMQLVESPYQHCFGW